MLYENEKYALNLDANLCQNFTQNAKNLHENLGENLSQISTQSPNLQSQNFTQNPNLSENFNSNLSSNLSKNSSKITKPKITKQIRFVKCDLCEKIDFKFHPNDIVVHLAARAYAPKPPLKPFGTHKLKDYFFEVNFEGTKNLTQTMLNSHCKRLIYFSTDMVYGKPKFLPVSTNHPRAPFGFYGLSKKASEDFLISQRENGLKACIFRPRMIIGAGRYVILLKLFALMRRNLPLPLIGNGTNCYQMVSVRDCAEAIVCAIEKGVPNDEFNLGSLNPPSVRDLLDFVRENCGSKSPILKTPAKLVKFTLKALEMLGLPLMFKEQYQIADEQYILDISKTQKMLGWTPKDDDKSMLLEAFRACEKG